MRGFQMSLCIKTLCICAIALNLIGCFGESAEIKQSQKIIKDLLIDPESAQFTDLKYYKASNFVCGKINSKNKMGGYVGAKQVAVDLTKAQAYIDPPRDTPDRPTAPPNSASIESLLSTIDYAISTNAWIEKVERVRREGAYFDNMIQNECKN
jgi:hypothetical protein